MYIQCRKLEKHVKNTEKQQPRQQKITSLNILVYVFLVFFPPKCMYIFVLSFQNGILFYSLLFFFFLTQQQTVNSSPWMSCFLKQIFQWKQSYPGTVVSLLCFFKNRGGMPHGHPNLRPCPLYFLLGKLIVHISMLKALRSPSIKNLLDFDQCFPS